MSEQPDEARDAYMLAMMEPVQPDIEELLITLRANVDGIRFHPMPERLIEAFEFQQSRIAELEHDAMQLTELSISRQATITSLTEQAEALVDFIEIAAWFGLHREEDEDCPVCWAKELLPALRETDSSEVQNPKG